MKSKNIDLLVNKSNQFSFNFKLANIPITSTFKSSYLLSVNTIFINYLTAL